jgi:hypothetical protein
MHNHVFFDCCGEWVEESLRVGLKLSGDYNKREHESQGSAFRFFVFVAWVIRICCWLSSHSGLLLFSQKQPLGAG